MVFRAFAASLLAFALLGCHAHDPVACKAACAKGPALAKQALAERLQGQPQEAVTDALAEWGRQETGLKAQVDGCAERCARSDDPGLLSCLESAQSLQAYTSCLK